MQNGEVEVGGCPKAELMTRMIGTCNQITQDLTRRMMDELSLSLAKYEVLLAVNSADNGEITMSNLSRELNVSNANMTGMTSRLQSDGFLEKRSLPTDRRIYSVALTEAGRDILEKAKVKYDLWIGELMAKFEEDTVQDFNGLLDKLSVKAS